MINSVFKVHTILYLGFIIDELTGGCMTEPSRSEVRFIDLLNKISIGWGDHLNQLEEERTHLQAVKDRDTPGQEYVIEITTRPFFDDSGNIENVMQVFLEIRLRGQPEGLETTIDWPLPIDERLSSEDDNALDIFFIELASVGFPATLLPE